MEKSTTRFSLVLVFVGLIQIAVAILQFVLSIYTSYSTIGLVGSGVALLFLALAIFMIMKPFRKITKEWEKVASAKTVSDSDTSSQSF
jgi:hypothetical protein